MRDFNKDIIITNLLLSHLQWNNIEQLSILVGLSVLSDGHQKMVNA